MSTNTWKQHLNQRGDPAVEGYWGKTPWAFYSYGELLPPELPVTHSMCVPVCSLDPVNPQIMLTFNKKRGGWEIPGGRREFKDGKPEPPLVTARRERGEETGLHTATKPLIPYGYIESRGAEKTDDPTLGYMQFSTAYTPDNPGLITEPKADGAGIFTIDALTIMVKGGDIRKTELELAYLGVRALFKYYDISDEHLIKVP